MLVDCAKCGHSFVVHSVDGCYESVTCTENPPKPVCLTRKVPHTHRCECKGYVQPTQPAEARPSQGFLEVGRDDREVIVNHPDLKPDANGVGHITFSPKQARDFAALLVKHADELEPAEALPAKMRVGAVAFELIKKEFPLPWQHRPDISRMAFGGIPIFISDAVPEGEVWILDRNDVLLKKVAFNVKAVKP